MICFLIIIAAFSFGCLMFVLGFLFGVRGSQIVAEEEKLKAGPIYGPPHPPNGIPKSPPRPR